MLADIRQILSKPGEAARSNREGIAHVISTMEWYCCLSEHLLNKKNVVVKPGLSQDIELIRKLLEERVIKLYKAILLYQMKSVCSYYRNQGWAFFRDLVGLDKLDDDLEGVKAAEKNVRDESNQYNGEVAKRHLGDLLESAEKRETQLGIICQTLGDLIADRKKMHMDAEQREYLDSLFVVDPQDDVTTIEAKDKLLPTSSNWVFETSEYKNFEDWSNKESTSPQCRLLWIKGHTGRGKTMLLIGIIRKLSNQLAQDAPNISYFFCQFAAKTRNNATATLRSLMWMLLLQQPHIITDLRKEFKAPLPKLFDDVTAFAGLSKAFDMMLKKLQSPVYFIVDALDECSLENQGLKLLIELISTSLDSVNVRWLVSSRPDVDVVAKFKELKNPESS